MHLQAIIFVPGSYIQPTIFQATFHIRRSKFAQKANLRFASTQFNPLTIKIPNLASFITLSRSPATVNRPIGDD
jgi:hypothetical protein